MNRLHNLRKVLILQIYIRTFENPSDLRGFCVPNRIRPSRISVSSKFGKETVTFGHGSTFLVNGYELNFKTSKQTFRFLIFRVEIHLCRFGQKL